MVVASTDSGRPAAIEACLAGDCPMFAERTLPKYTSLIFERGTPDFARADFMAVAPRMGAGTVV